MKHDPHLPWIWGFFSAGLLCTGFSIPGYLHQTEKLNLGLIQIEMPAPVRKLPLSLLGAVFMIASWNETQNRRDWKAATQEERHHQSLLRRVANRSELQGHYQATQYLAQMQAAQQVYGQLQPYLDVPHQDVDAPPQLPPVTPSSQGAIAPYPPAVTPVSQPATPALPSSSQDNYAYLDLFTEYAGLLFGGQGSGKSWTTRLIVARKKQAGQRVIVLDPHAAQHEWIGVEHIGSGMDYRAIADFLRWYLSEVVRRYRDFSQSGLSEAQWQAQMRQQGKVLSVVCEEMTNWADRLPDGLSAEFMKTGMSDSRKALMPPLFVAHNRTLSCLGDAKGLAHLRDSSLLELELVPTIHEVTFQPVASGNGRLKLPGHSQWRDVKLPPASQKITDFRAYGPAGSESAPYFQSTSNLTSGPLPGTSTPQPPEVNYPSASDLRKSLEGLYQASSDMQDFQAEGTSESSELALYQTIKALLEVDKSTGKPKASKTWVVENVLGCKGRKFEEGMKRLEQLLQRYGG